ncbi:alpha/beta fold hydrolase [Spirosoma utsteinense]|uniref:Pimeloyl-ACP methyl ester carboxylesterase n=1 Tax=Spirosoma utsteinense TaxID=2585773 RepID=A0ABR6W3N0_9BACT|nr:alpha/beta fold hydrolase [Spirosoma utsteinense]MBC3784768.1 pimeloyl-ACP methyl ester carboxylesterase [Spirosoma utsteinense]MBC3791195.1 pimeloyl-ACP methyl ester carboxylesterase [Spirosoma utsteinense]
MPNRIFLIHGYVEDPTIFDKLVPLLPPANYVRINLADEFGRWQPTGSVNVQRLAQYLTSHYTITKDDVVIGHSMGGWTAIHIKQLSGARAIQLASWTDQKKIRFPTDNLTILKLLLNTGITQSRTLTNFFKRQYPFDESRDLYIQLLEGTLHMTRLYLWQQLQTLFAKVPTLTVQPDLRIHSRADSIVAAPDEAFRDVPGDHFSLVFYPELVAEPIRSLLSKTLPVA